MNTTLRLLAASAVALTLAACQHGLHRHGHSPFTPRPEAPNVLIQNGVVVLDQDPLVFGPERRLKPSTITWQLDPKNPEGYSFDPERGITFVDAKAAAEEFRCRSEGPHTFVCLNRHTKPGKYAYVIQLLDREHKPVKPVDPSVINM